MEVRLNLKQHLAYRTCTVVTWCVILSRMRCRENKHLKVNANFVYCSQGLLCHFKSRHIAYVGYVASYKAFRFLRLQTGMLLFFLAKYGSLKVLGCRPLPQGNQTMTEDGGAILFNNIQGLFDNP